MATKNNKIKTVIICVLVFVIWAGLSLYRTLNRNMDWFDKQDLVATENEEKEKK